MEQRYKLLLTVKNICREISLPVSGKNMIIGTEVGADVRLMPEDFFAPFSFQMIYEGGEWSLECEEDIYLTSESDIQKRMYVKLKPGGEYLVKYLDSGAEALRVVLAEDFDYLPKKYDRMIPLKGIAEITIGGASGNDLQLAHPLVRKDRVRIQKKGDVFTLFVDAVGYGVSLNGNEQKTPCRLQNMDFFAVGPYSFCFSGNTLYTDSSSDIVYHEIPYADQSESTRYFDYPKFNRDTRIMHVLNGETIIILDPPEPVKKPKMNIINQLFPSIAMIAVIVLLRGMMGNSGVTYILFSVASMGVGVISTVMAIVTEKKQYREDVKKREEVYRQYIEKKSVFIEECRKQEADALRKMYYSVPRELEMVDRFLPELFERRPSDRDFLELCLGNGDRAAYRRVEYKARERVEEMDELMGLPEQLQERYRLLKDVPVTLCLTEVNAVGIVGDREELYSILKVFTLDLAVRHYYTEVQFLYCIGGADAKRFSWIRMLPHIQNEKLNRRNIICDDESKNALFDYLYKEIRLRPKGCRVPYLVVFVYRDNGFKTHPLSGMQKEAKEKGIVFLFFEEEFQKLPMDCERILELNGDKTGTLIDSSGEKRREVFRFYNLETREIRRVVQRLAPVYCEEISLESTLTKSITLFELLNIIKPEDINLERAWGNSDATRSLDAPLGVKANNQIVSLDIHEKGHGPHGLVAGTTGSGKSELLQTYILSMALRYHPYDVSFVIIDFKGGGMANQFRSLPHLIGTITNIDGREMDRSLLSIRAELKKRQKMFALADVNNIDDYIRLYKAGGVKQPLPHLILIVDEFAELKTDQPEFMKELVSTARIGRSLGVHLILATQKPSGVVDPQIWSNSRFKLCLKVQSMEDSNEILKTPLAAEIKEPGRAYLQVGNNEIFELFQSAYSGGPARIEGVTAKKEFVVSRVNLAGKRIPIYVQKKEIAQKDEVIKTQLDVFVEYISRYCSQKGIKKLESICLPPLAEVIPYPENIQAVRKDGIEKTVEIGVLDDPQNQAQMRTVLNLTAENVLIIGSSQYGKTNLLQTIIRGLASRYTPDEVNIYILDFASGSLKTFENLDHVGGVVLAAEDEKFKNLFKMLAGAVEERKQKLTALGVSSYTAYCEAGQKDLPQIVLLVDNYTAVKELYLTEEDPLLYLLREGISVGISVVICNSQTTGLGFRYLSLLAKRIALYCNESSEYSGVIEHCRIVPEEIPGRAVIMVQKSIYIMQTYLSFSGEREIERIQKIRDFIERCNVANEGRKARHIPEIPAVLEEGQFVEEYRNEASAYMVPLGLDYENINPFRISLTSIGVFCVSGRKGSGKTNILRLLFGHLYRNMFREPTDVYLIDGMNRRLREFREYGFVKDYSIDAEDILNYVELAYNEAVKRHDAVVNEEMGLDEEPLLLIVVQNDAVIQILSKNTAAMKQYRELTGKLAGMKVCFLYMDLANAAIGYSSPEILKDIKEKKNILFTDDLRNLKLIDIPGAEARKYKKKISAGDAYWLGENGIEKVKIIKAERQAGL